MHFFFLGVLSTLGRLVMLFAPGFKGKHMIDLLNERIAGINQDMLAAYHMPPIAMTKTPAGSYKLPIGKAAHSKNFFCFFARSVFSGLVPPDMAAVLDFAVRIALALASGAYYTRGMEMQLHTLIVEFHVKFAAVFGFDNVLPNFHMSACA